MRQLIILSVIIALTLVPVVGMAQTNWEKYPANPVLGLGKGGRWDDADVLHPNVVFDGSKFHLWYAGDSGSHSNIGYAWSEDGIVWEKYTGNPVLEDGAGRVWDGEFVTHPSVLYDGVQYRMWYAGYDGTNIRIGYATSTDGIVWNKHGSNPVLDLGASGSWDAMGVSGPTVVLENGNYRMWYTGYDGTNTRIGYATSADGVVWNKHGSNPVLDLGASGSWDAMGVSGPTVLLDGNTYHMWYIGYDGTNIRIGYAASADGVVWNKYASNPVLNPGAGGSWDAAGVSSPTVVLEKGNYRMWYTGYDRANGRIGLSYTGCAGVTIPRANVTAHAHANPATYEAISPDGAEVILNGSQSIGSDGNPITDENAYEWDFDYDGDFQPDTTGKLVTHVYYSIGEYTAALRVTDSSGSSIDTVNIKVEDTKLPLVKLLAPHGGEAYQGGSTVSILWEPAADIVSLQNNAITLSYNTDGGDWQLIAKNKTNDGQYDWMAPVLNSADVKVKIEATDATGNVGSDTSSEKFIIDSQSPVVELTAPNGGEILRGGGVFPIIWQLATDNIGLADVPIRLHYSIDGGTNWQLIAEGERNNGQFDWDVPALDSDSALVRVEVFDRAGNIGEDISDSPFSVDNTAPTVVLTYPNGGEVLRGSDSIDITWEPAVDAYLADNPISLFYSLAGLDGWIPIAENQPNDGNYPWGIPLFNSQSVRVKVIAADAADNIGEDTSDAEFTVDTNSPVPPVFLSPTSGTVTNQDMLTIEGTAEAMSIVTLLDNEKILGTAAANVSGVFGYTTPSLADGIHNFTATATDAAGNVSNVSAVTAVTVDTVKPAPPVLLSPSSGTITNQNMLILTGTAEVESTVTLLDNGEILGTAAANVSGVFGYTTPSLADGIHNFTATATDVAGNVSDVSADTTVTVDTSSLAPPVLLLPSSGTITNQNVLTLTGTAEVGNTVTLLDNGEILGTAPTDTNGSFNYTTRALADGIHSFTATATDVAGNISDSSPATTVTVDTTVPTLSVSLDKQEYTTNESVQIIYTATDNLDVSPSVTMTITPDFLVPTDNKILPPLPAGILTVTITATDDAGNSAVVSASAIVKALDARLDVTPNLFEIQIPKKPKKPEGKDKTVLLTGYFSLSEGLSLSKIKISSLRLNSSLIPKNVINRESVLEMQFEVDKAFVASLLSLDVALIDKLEQNANSIRVFLNTPVAMASITLGRLQVTGVLNDQVAFASEDASRHIALKEVAAPAATRSFLAQNYPNPFNPETWIPYALASDAYVTIHIFDACGNLVRHLELGYQEANFYMERGKAAYWDGRTQLGTRAASGLYFYTLNAGNFIATRKMVILK